ncbi:TIGR01777 family oxidoreductase [Acinetobacter pragensis]|uniref:Nucleoside-diphosphate sugar epimerase n=1 Tax=Acinetobacter pragensis TaxID=1806892 RepID=A0A151XZZ8_9GAMM|nr:TIGR01777 family oxidoreductase [Acinetobacter pragensis]KYQ71373.1 nucleoside-diphosphate sugar epimerase [Acinetobacter pragensis]
MHKERVLITGASGFIGTRLIQYLLSKDYAVVGLSRQANLVSRHPDMQWIAQLDELKSDQIDYVVNLAGESIGKGRWTAARKQQLIRSRVETTENLYRYLERRRITPKCIISGSAVGYYGIDAAEQWQNACTEDSPPQHIFQSELCQQWEKAALQFPNQNTKIIRLGIVLSAKGGILPQMLQPIRMNLAGRIGHGRQPVVWVHIRDVLRAIEFLMDKQPEARIFNLTAPERISQAIFSELAACQLHKHPVLCLPAWVMKIMLGEQSQLVLNGQYVKPQALSEAGFIFNFPTLKEALADLLS